MAIVFTRIDLDNHIVNLETNTVEIYQQTATGQTDAETTGLDIRQMSTNGGTNNVGMGVEFIVANGNSGNAFTMLGSYCDYSGQRVSFGKSNLSTKTIQRGQYCYTSGWSNGLAGSDVMDMSYPEDISSVTIHLEVVSDIPRNLEWFWQVRTSGGPSADVFKSNSIFTGTTTGWTTNNLGSIFIHDEVITTEYKDDALPIVYTT